MIKKLLLTTMIMLLVCACVSSKPFTSSVDKDGCITPLYDVAFPVVTPEPGAITPRQIPPQGRWQIQDVLPLQQERAGIVSRQRQSELWLRFQDTDEIYRYSIENKEWKSYQTIESAQTVPSILFAANDGTIWGAGRKLTDHIDWKKTYPLLSRFNDATDRFEFVPDNAGLLEVPNVSITSNIAEDQSGLLWFFAGDILYSFDVKIREAQPHYSDPGSGSSLAIAPDGSIWFREHFKHQLVRYIPASQKVRFYKGYPEPIDTGAVPFDVTEANQFSFDHSGKLWFDNHGWLDFSGNNDSPVWYQALESPVFITDQSLPESQYLLAYQFSMYQSSNGWYWFTGGNGIVRLNLQKGSWCLMTTGISDVVEDNDQNLWIAVFSHLYKYDLQAE